MPVILACPLAQVKARGQHARRDSHMDPRYVVTHVDQIVADARGLRLEAVLHEVADLWPTEGEDLVAWEENDDGSWRLVAMVRVGAQGAERIILLA